MFSQWLGIRGLDAAIPLALISGIIGLCWTLPAALLPIAVLSHLGDAQKASILFFGVSVFGVAGSIAVPLLVHHLGRRFIIVLGITLTIFSGVCLSIDKVYSNVVRFYVSKETLNKTTFKHFKDGEIINLEKSLKFGSRISGHFVQGHVDTTSKVKKIIRYGKSWYVDFYLSKQFHKYIIPKGSIAINGVSLTISKLIKDGFQIVVIPHTLKLTNLIFLKEKDLVNVEFDVLSKYIKNFLN